MCILQMKFDLFPIVSTIVESNRSNAKLSRISITLVSFVFVNLLIDLQLIGWLFLISEFYLKLLYLSEPEWPTQYEHLQSNFEQSFVFELKFVKQCLQQQQWYKWLLTPQISRINHPMNCLDHWSNLVSNQEANPVMGPSSQGRWRSTGNHKLHQDRRIKRDSFLREIEELRQVYNMQYTICNRM